MFVRTAGERDLAEVRALLVETWHATYDAIYGAEQGGGRSPTTGIRRRR